MRVKPEILSRQIKIKINKVSERLFRKRLFYTGILPDPFFRGVGEFGDTATTIIPKEIRDAKMAAYRIRLKSLPIKKSDNFPTTPE